MKSKPLDTEKSRCVSLDLFRALIILAFLFLNMLGTFVLESDIPLFLRHNQGSVLLFADLIAPAFAFVLGAALYFSHKKSLVEKTPLGFRKIRGFVELLLLGIVLDGLFCKGVLGFCLNWGVLQSLGLGGLFALLFVKLDNRIRLASCLTLLLIYSQINIHIFAFPSQDPFRHGGVIGGIGYGFVSVFGLICAELFHKDRKKLILLGAALLAMSFAASILIPFNKLEVTASFVLISSSLSIFFWLFLTRFSIIPGFFHTLSRHALFLWVLQYLFVWYPLSILGIWEIAKFGFVSGAELAAVCTLFFVTVLFIWKRYTARNPKLDTRNWKPLSGDVSVK